MIGDWRVKRWIASLLVAIVAISVAWGVPEKLGDFDEDGVATILDVVRLINHVNDTRTLSGELEPFADINGDGSVDQNDVLELVDRVLERLPLESLPLTFLSKGSPASGEGDVAVTRETILKFSSPLGVEHGLDADSLFATFGGQRLSTRIHISQDRTSVTLFYNNPLPANSRIRVTLVGDEVVDNRGRNIDGDGDGAAGGDLVFDFDTLGLTVLEGTSVSGRVFASELAVAAAADVHVNQPLEGAIVTVDGMEDQIFAVTDEFGNFRLDPAPVGRFFVHIDGRAATVNVPPGAYYPFVGKAWESIPGEEVNVGNVYLPLVKEGTLQEVSSAEPTTIRMSPLVLDEFPDFENVSITVPADSLFSDNGTRGGMVGIAPVDPSRLPGTLPPDLNFPIVITVQTDGATNFDTPASVCFPNLPDLETGETLQPGEKSALWSFNHDTGRFEIAGSMTVSADGSLICSDPGQGVLAPGWHGTRPGAVVEGGVITLANPDTNSDLEPGTSPESRAPPACTLWGLCGPLNEIQSFVESSFNTAHSAAKEITRMVKSFPAAISSDGKADPVYYFSGEFAYASIDMQIKGRGIDFIWSRRYRSKVGPDTAQGNGWDYSYRVFIEEDGDDLILFDGNGRSDRYIPSGSNRWSRNEFFRDLVRNDDGTYTLEFEDKGRWVFNSFATAAGEGKLAAVVDRNGNQLNLFYDAQDRLVRVNDTLDRDITIAYDANGFVASVTDFVGRTVSYDYYDGVEPGGGFGDLKSCTMPAVTGTPNGNDFPDGKTTTYTYTRGFADERLNSNLLTITDGRRNDTGDPTFGDGPYLQNVYASTQDPDDFNYDRVVRQIWGGDVVDLDYTAMAPAGPNGAATKTILNDRNGNVTEYYFDQSNRLVNLREFTGRANPGSRTTALSNRPTGKLRDSDPDFFETRYAYNEDSLVTEIVHPNGNVTENIYEGDLNPSASPRTRGNLRVVRRTPGNHSPAGDQTVIEQTFEYDSSFGCGACGFNFVTRHVDGRGNETLIDYDARGNLVQTRHRIASIVENFEYNTFGQLTAQVLPDNGSNHRRRDEFTYYDSGVERGYLKDQIIDAPNLGLTTTFRYDAVGNIVSVTDPRGNDSQIVYNQLDQVVRTLSREVEDGSGIRYERDYFYDANNNVVRVDVQNRDEDGALQANTHFSTVWEYEILNNPIARTEEVDSDTQIVTEFEYDGNRNLVLFRKGEATNGNQPQNVVAFTYDERDLLFTETKAPGDPAQSTSEMDYDPNGNLVVTRLGVEDEPRVVVQQYDGYDRRVATVDPMGNSMAFSYDANDNVVGQRVDGERSDEIGDASNVLLSETLFTYDPLDRIIKTEDSFFDTATGTDIADGAATTNIGYTNTSQILTVTDDNSHSTSFEYDTANRLVVSTDPAGNESTVAYDANSNIVTVVSLEKNDLGSADESFTTTFSYDNLDRRIEVVDNRNNAYTTRFDSRNNPTLTVDALGNAVVNVFDGLNRLLSTARILTDNGEGSGNVVEQIVTANVWDDSHRLIQRIDPNGNATTTEYDPLDRSVRRVYADATERVIGYDVHDNRVSFQDANGNEVVAQYDLLNRLVRKDITPGAGISADTLFEDFEYDGLSRLVRAEDDDSLVIREFDSLSQLTKETLNGQTTTSVYDAIGNLLSCVYPSGRVIDSEYDALDRKSLIVDNTNSGSPVEVARFDFVGPSRIARRDYGNGTRTDFTYDGITGVPNPTGDFGVRNVINTRHTNIGSGAVIAEHDYAWDRVGNKVARVDVPGSINQNFGYDSAYRLIQSVKNGVGTDYQIDLAHNRTQVTGAENPGNYNLDPTTPNPADAKMNQYTATPQGARSHDENGNLLSDSPGRAFTYDYANRMVQFTNGSTNASYRYDALGRRISKSVDGQSTLYFYSPGGRVCEEQAADNATIATYVHGLYIDDVVQMRRAGEDYFYHTDDLYSTVALSDSNGDLVEATEYGDYGEPSASSVVENPYMFTGRRYDPETGFYYYRTRYLDPLAGRFTTRDTIGIWGDPMEFGNGYAYVGNNPFTMVDPYGLGPIYMSARAKERFFWRPARLILSTGANLATLVGAGGLAATGAGAPVAIVVGGVAVTGLADNGTELSNIILDRDSAQGYLSSGIQWTGLFGRVGSDRIATVCGLGANIRTLSRVPAAAATLDLPNKTAKAAQLAREIAAQQSARLSRLSNRFGGLDSIALGGDLLVEAGNSVRELWNSFNAEEEREHTGPAAVFERSFVLPVWIPDGDEAAIRAAVGRGDSFTAGDGGVWAHPK